MTDSDQQFSSIVDGAAERAHEAVDESPIDVDGLQERAHEIVDKGKDLGTAAFERARAITEEQPAVGIGVLLVAVGIASFVLGAVIFGGRRD